LGSTDAELSILLTDDRTIRELNAAWRRLDRATDVLSFAQVEAGEGRPASGLLGDLVISTETAARQARRVRWPLEREIERLLVHGILHLHGYDHVRGGVAARRMRRAEARLRALLSRSRRQKPLRRRTER
jgi:probable rRNA maturation factor